MFDPGPEVDDFLKNDKSASSIFVPKMKDRECLKDVLFRGPAYLFWSNFETNDKVPYDSILNPTPPSENHKLRFKTNLLMIENGMWVAKIWENSNSVRKQIIDLVKQHGDISDILFSITRNGLKTDTKYAIMPMFVGRTIKTLSEDAKKQVEAVKLHDLKPKDNVPF